MKINLGCGNSYLGGYINCDISKEVKADQYFDARKGLPFPDNSAEEIVVGCILEQICSNDDFKFVLNEIWRVLEKDGKIIGYVPNANFPCAFQDPMDCRFFTEETFKYFDINHTHYSGFGKHYGFKPWKNIWVSTNESGILHFQMTTEK